MNELEGCFLQDGDKSKCTGCAACKTVCPKNAISMVEDSQGFLYPKIDKEKCINCNLCIKSCPYTHKIKEVNNQIIYAAKHNDSEVRLSSSSGGAFTAISDYILSKSGVIYGAAYDEKFNVYHTRATDKKSRDSFRGSKYVQSNISNTYSLVKTSLESGVKVLFTGTPCQIDGLLSFLKKEYDNLYTCDIICHGTPSSAVFQDYKNYVEKKYNSKIDKIDFRSKVKGWNKLTIKIDLKNAKRYISSFEKDPYGTFFLNYYILRPSCYKCKYTNFDRVSDITIADFWGIEKVNSKFDDNIGTSLILVNSLKGHELFNNIKNDIEYFESNKAECAVYQENLKKPSKMPEKYEEFWRDYYKHSFKYMSLKYCKLQYFKLSIKKIIINITKLLGIYRFVKGNKK